MANQSVTLQLPDDLYTRIQRRAQQAQHSIEDELVLLVLAGSLETPSLPDDLVSSLDQLTLLDDAELWRAARSHLAPDDAERLEELHLKQQRVGLDAGEEGTQALLARVYERFMLIRAQAAYLLAQRGHELSSLLLMP